MPDITMKVIEKLFGAQYTDYFEKVRYYHYGYLKQKSNHKEKEKDMASYNLLLLSIQNIYRIGIHFFR